VPGHTVDGFDDRDELQLADYLAILKRRWRWLGLSVVLVVSLAGGYSTMQPAAYRASASVLVRPSAAEGIVRGASTNPGMLSRELTNEINYALSDQVAEAVRGELGDLPDVTVTGDRDADVLQFTATAGLPDHAAHIANTWAGAYVAQKQADTLASVEAATGQLTERLESLRVERDAVNAPVNGLRDELALTEDPLRRLNLETRIDRASSDAAAALAVITAQEQAVAKAIADLQLQGELDRSGTVRIVANAQPPAAPGNAPLSRNLALGLVLGLVVGAGAALLRENLDTAVKSVEDVQRLVGLPVLAAVPPRRRRDGGGELGLATLSDPSSMVADAYHKLRTGVQFSMVNRDIRTLLVTSPNQGEGKTVTSTNLAWALTAVARRVLLLDGDFRRPRVHEVFGFDNTFGLSDHILSRQPLANLAVGVELGSASLGVISTGPLPQNPAELVSSRSFALALKAAAASTDLVVIDGPPVLPVSDALTLARLVDAVVLVARAGETTAEELRTAHDSLRQVGGHVLGVVLIGAGSSSKYGKYGYYGADAKTARRGSTEIARVVLPPVQAPRAAVVGQRAVSAAPARRRGRRRSTVNG
jgi:polysaccharide biosynthesis transport protein